MKNSLLFCSLAALVLFSACKKDDNGLTPEFIESSVIGQWKIDTKADSEYLTNEKEVFTFNLENTGFLSMSREMEKLGFVWGDRTPMVYTVDGTVLKIAVDGTYLHLPKGSVIKIDLNITGITSNSLSFDSAVITMPDGRTVENKTPHTYKKIVNDFSEDIVGLWEGVELTGEPTYGGAEARIEFKADGSYTYYKKSEGLWLPSENVDNEYNVDGDWLATRWRPQAGANYEYEWWDIDSIKNGTMIWSALRGKADGTTYKTTFTWKKVEGATE